MDSMTKEEIIEKLTNIGTIEDEVERRDLLTSLIDDVQGQYDIFETTKTENESLKDENQKLVDYNRKLFMKVSIDETPETINQELTGKPDIETREPRKFEDLFDEKGNLK